MDGSYMNQGVPVVFRQLYCLNAVCMCMYVMERGVFKIAHFKKFMC